MNRLAKIALLVVVASGLSFGQNWNVKAQITIPFNFSARNMELPAAST